MWENSLEFPTIFWCAISSEKQHVGYMPCVYMVGYFMRKYTCRLDDTHFSGEEIYVKKITRIPCDIPGGYFHVKNNM